jgi:hypothetical protein
MTPLEECENLTNPKLLIEIHNRDALIKTKTLNNDILRAEIDKLWKLMERNARK